MAENRNFFFSFEKDIIGFPPEQGEPSYTRVLPTTFIPEWLKKRLEFFYPDSQSRSDYITGLLVANLGEIFSDPTVVDQAIKMIEISSKERYPKSAPVISPKPLKKVVYLKPLPVDDPAPVKAEKEKLLPNAPVELPVIEEAEHFVGNKVSPFLLLKGGSMTAEEAKFLGDSISQARTKANLSQRQLAEKLGITRGSLFRYEKGSILENKEKYEFILKTIYG